MDRMSVSEADDTGSIPVGCTNYVTYSLNFQELTCHLSLLELLTLSYLI